MDIPLSVQVLNVSNKPTIALQANGALIQAGGNGTAGQLKILNSGGTVPMLEFNAGTGSLGLGADGNDGEIFVYAGTNPKTLTVHVDGNTGQLSFFPPGNFSGGVISMRNGNNFKEIVRIDSVVGPSSDFINYPGGRITVRDSFGNNRIILNGPEGKIITQGADCAEDFDVAQPAGVDPGTVVVLDDDGRVEASRKPYDRRVAGVVSGAGEYEPSLVLDRQEGRPDRLPVALMGKVYCKVDARYAAIEVGDLLTTSETLGHAMRAGDPARAFGAVIGKALRSLSAGQGMIPVLVALQ